MTAEEFLKQGDADAALASLQERVRRAPEDAPARVFLFQLLCVLGQWRQAVAELRICAKLDPAAVAMAQVYREAIICEIYRDRVFRAEKAPLVRGAYADWMTWLIEALACDAAGDTAAAERRRARAFEAAPAVPGVLNGRPFSWVADADPRLGPVLEFILNGQYYWTPLTDVERLKLDPPADLRDVVWMPATVNWAAGGDDVVLIPTRYAGPAEATDVTHRLSRATGWISDGDRIIQGVGQRLIATDSDECALMDLRDLHIGTQSMRTAVHHG